MPQQLADRKQTHHALSFFWQRFDGAGWTLLCCSCWRKCPPSIVSCLQTRWRISSQVREMSRTVNAAQMKLVEGEEGDKLELSSLMEVAFITLTLCLSKTYFGNCCSVFTCKFRFWRNNYSVELYNQKSPPFGGFFIFSYRSFWHRKMIYNSPFGDPTCIVLPCYVCNTVVLYTVWRLSLVLSSAWDFSCSDPKANVRPHWQHLSGSPQDALWSLRWGKQLSSICAELKSQVVVLDLEVLAEISSSKTGRPIEAASSPPTTSSTSPHFKQFMLSLLKLFSADRSLLEAKGSFIIRQLCVLLSSEDIYRSISELLVLEDNLKFARLMVETLSTILLTSSELFELRTKLKVA